MRVHTRVSAGIVYNGLDDDKPKGFLELDHCPSLRSFIADYRHWNSYDKQFMSS